MRNWLENHPLAVLLLIALAVVASSFMAWMVREASFGRLPLPAATFVGALTTIVSFGIVGVAVGLAVGLLFIAHRRFKLVQDARRVGMPFLVPLVIAVVAGYAGRSAHYSGSPAAWPLSLAIYGLAIVLVLVFLRFVRLPQRRTRPTDSASTDSASNDSAAAAEPGDPPGASPSWVALALTAVLVAACAASGIWLGRQLDVQRRIWTLNRVGRVYIGVAENLVGGAYGAFLGQRAGDRHLRLLRGLPDMSEISVHDAAITDDGCRHLAAMRNLKLLDLTNVPVGDDGVRHISGMPNLQWVFLRQTEVTRESFRILMTLPQLRNIIMEDIVPEGPSLGEIKLSATLQELHLTGCGLTDDDLAPLATLDLVRRLTLRDNQIKGPGLVHVAANTGLGSVYLGGNPIDDRYLACFSAMSLNGLDLNGIRLTEPGVDAIATQSMLEFIAVRRSGITDQQLQRIATSTKLRDAELDATNLSPAALQGWRPRDVGLYLEHAAVDASEVKRLAHFGLDVHLIQCELTAGAAEELKHHPRLFDMTDCRIGGRVVSGVYPHIESQK